MDPLDLAEVEAFVGLGSTLAGKYRIERILGVGGMGVVVAAVHTGLGERVAIKYLLPNTLGKNRRSARFLREARAVSRMRSRHVARVHDVDVRDDGAPYIVMEYLEGETLAAGLKREGPLGFQQVADTALELCEAVAEAHSLGIVHRDIKPANVFLARGAGNVVSVKVLDFGISKVEDSPDGGDGFTTGDGFLGSPPYMSPEQLTQPTLVDHRTDIWSIGVTLYACVTGRAAFKGESTGEVCALVLQHRPEPVETLRPDVPAALARAIACCMHKDRERRFGTVLELARALAETASERGKRALAVTEAIGATKTAANAPTGATGATGAPAVDVGTLSAAAETKGPVSARSAQRWSAGSVLGASAGVALLLAAGVWAIHGASVEPGGLHSVSATPQLAPPSAGATLPSPELQPAPPTPSASVSTGVASAASAAVTTASARAPAHPAKAKALTTTSNAGNPKRHFDPVFDERR